MIDAGRPTALPLLGGLPAGVAVRSFALSADGARIALLVDRWTGRWRGGVREPPARGPVLVVARVVRGPNGRIVRRLDQAYARADARQRAGGPGRTGLGRRRRS